MNRLLCLCLALLSCLALFACESAYAGGNTVAHHGAFARRRVAVVFVQPSAYVPSYPTVSVAPPCQTTDPALSAYYGGAGSCNSYGSFYGAPLGAYGYGVTYGVPLIIRDHVFFHGHHHH